MEQKYDILFVTTMPSFYKVNLFNEIAKERKILVLYSGSTEGVRSADFSSAEARYDSQKLPGNKILAVWQTMKLLFQQSFDKAIVSGWDNIISYVVALLHKKSRNGCIVESSIRESRTRGIKANLKRFLLSKVSIVYASGTSQRQLAEALGFKGEIVEFGGCGVLNYLPQPPYEPRAVVKNFLYVGRIAEVKNLPLLISVFNEFPDLSLTIIGDGPLRQELEKQAKQNIHFLGAINNKELPKYYKDADVFVLPSKSEPWGLVIEEALNNGTPVIVSSAVGCSDSIVSPYSSGIVFESGNKDSLKEAVLKMCDVDYYNRVRQNVSSMDFIERARGQVKAFIQA